MTDQTNPAKKSWEEWKEEWRIVVQVIFNPITLVGVAVTAGLAHFLPDNTFVISLAATILGGIIWDKWSRLKGKTILVNKGKSAIRSLKLLLRNLNDCEMRVTTYLDRHKEGAEGTIVNNWLEEEIHRLGALQEEALDSISNWTDIIPEADVTAQLAPYRELQASYLTIKAEKKQLQDELEQASADDAQREDKLKDELREKVDELEKVKERLTAERVRIGSSLLSGLSSRSTVTIGYPNRYCSECGAFFAPATSEQTLCTPCFLKTILPPPPPPPGKEKE